LERGRSSSKADTPGWAAEQRFLITVGAGAQKALINARLNEGLAKGFSLFAVGTAQPQEGQPNSSFANLTRAGFGLSYVRKNYVLPDAV